MRPLVLSATPSIIILLTLMILLVGNTIPLLESRSFRTRSVVTYATPAAPPTLRANPTAAPTATPTSTSTPTATPANTPTPTKLPRSPLSGAVSYTGCASDGKCEWFNFYWVPTGEAVVQPGEPFIKVQHELCHRHQHLTINGGGPTAVDLSAWYLTAEAQSYQQVAGGWPYPQETLRGRNLLEDFAWMCAYYHIDPEWLAEASPARYRWALEMLP